MCNDLGFSPDAVVTLQERITGNDHVEILANHVSLVAQTGIFAGDDAFKNYMYPIHYNFTPKIVA